MSSNIFMQTMNSAWARGAVQQADLDTFKEAGAKVPEYFYRVAGQGNLTMGYLLVYWELCALNPLAEGNQE